MATKTPMPAYCAVVDAEAPGIAAENASAGSVARDREPVERKGWDYGNVAEGCLFSASFLSCRSGGGCLVWHAMEGRLSSGDGLHVDERGILQDDDAISVPIGNISGRKKSLRVNYKNFNLAHQINIQGKGRREVGGKI